MVIPDYENARSNGLPLIKNKSITDAILDIIHQVITTLERRELVNQTLCDQNKAFGCVQRIILIQKLYFSGVRGLPSQLFQSYIQNSFY